MKKINQNNWSLKRRGFSLVELLIVVVIVTIFSVSTVVSFNYLGDMLKTREVTSFIADMVKQEELKVLRGDFEKVTIHFYSDYLVVAEEEEGVTLKMEHENGSCPVDQHRLSFTHGGNLTQRDGSGVVLQIQSVDAASTSECLDFKSAEGVEWNYQLTQSDQYSNAIRFIHFNLQRENRENNPISITSGMGSKIEITAPYSKKRIYDNNNSVQDSVDVEVQDEGHNSDSTVTFR